MSEPSTLASFPSQVINAAETLWDFHHLGEQVIPADTILVFGSNDLRVAEHAALLYRQKLAPLVLFSGARGRMTQAWLTTEAEAMAEVAIKAGVPETDILIENQATNTGENIRFSRDLLASSGHDIHTAILIQKPYMERRTRAAVEVQWPQLNFRVSSPALNLTQYCVGELTPDLVISAMVGDFQRIIDYPKLGFASRQNISIEAKQAFDLLVEAGFSSQLR